LLFLLKLLGKRSLFLFYFYFLKMRNLEFLASVLVIGFIGWKSQIANSATVVQKENSASSPLVLSRKLRSANGDIELFQEAAREYRELATAYYSPAKDESVREKRTLGLIRNIANRTRSGFVAIRSLFTGGSTGGTGGFRTFFGNLLQRFLILLTNLWDRITGIFRGGRLGGGGGGIFSIFRPTTTTESYIDDTDFYYSSSTTTTTEKVSVVDNTLGELDAAAKEAGTNFADAAKSLEDAADDFIPFPGDEVNRRSGKAMDDGSKTITLGLDNKKPVNIGIEYNKRSTDPEASPLTASSEVDKVKPASVIHLIDDGRRFGV